jgi:hypothetical protein
MKAIEDRYYKAIGASLALYLKDLRRIKKAFGLSDAPGAGMSHRDPRYDALCEQVSEARRAHEARCTELKESAHIA